MTLENTGFAEINEFAYPLEDNKYPDSPWASQNRVQEALRVTYCDSLGLPAVDQHIILDELARTVGENFGTNFVLAGTNGFGLRIAGLSGYDLFGELSDDGNPASHNMPTNDADIHVVTFENTPHEEMLDQMEKAIVSGADKMLSVHPSIHYLTPYEVIKSGKNAWEMPTYLTFRMKYYRHTNIDSLEVHHLDIPDNNWGLLWNSYQPSKSNLIGSPIYLGVPAVTKYGKIEKLSHFVANPFDTASNWNDQHLVSLSSPEHFGDTIFSVPQTSRVLFSVFTYSMATGQPAVMDSSSMNILARTTDNWAPALTDAQRVKAEKRVKTLLHRAGTLESSISDHSELGHLKKQLGSFPENLAGNLDQIKWGEKIFGKTCDSLLS